MKWYEIVLACLPLYVGIIVLIVTAEKRFTRLETNFKWIQQILTTGQFCPMAKKEDE